MVKFHLQPAELGKNQWSAIHQSARHIKVKLAHPNLIIPSADIIGRVKSFTTLPALIPLGEIKSIRVVVKYYYCLHYFGSENNSDW